MASFPLFHTLILRSAFGAFIICVSLTIAGTPGARQLQESKAVKWCVGLGSSPLCLGLPFGPSLSFELVVQTLQRFSARFPQ